MQYGLATLGAAKYSDLVLREAPAGWVINVFTNVFGDALPFVKQLARLGRNGIKLDFCYKPKNARGPTYTRNDFPAIIREVRRFAPVIRNNPHINWYVSGATEHDLNRKDANDLGLAVMHAISSPGARYVNNPQEGKGAFIDWGVNEVHGANAQRPNAGVDFAWSADGDDVFDFNIEDLKERFLGAQYFLFWASQFNLKKKADDSTPISRRTAKPTGDLIDATIYLKNDRGPVTLPDRYLVKPKADQDSVPPEPRALKPVVIIPPKVERIELVADNGQVVAVSGAPEPFVDGRFRYYFNQFGYQISEKARRIHGKPTVSMRIRGKIVGECNMAFRCGAERK